MPRWWSGKAACLVTHAGVTSLIPGFSSLSYETLNQVPQYIIYSKRSSRRAFERSELYTRDYDQGKVTYNDIYFQQKSLWPIFFLFFSFPEVDRTGADLIIGSTARNARRARCERSELYGREYDQWKVTYNDIYFQQKLLWPIFFLEVVKSCHRKLTGL